MGSSGGGGSTSGVNTNYVGIPKFLQPGLQNLEKGGTSQELAAQGSLPSIAALYGQVPLQGVAPLTPEQLGTISSYEGINTGPNTPESTALGTLTGYATRDPLQDPAVIAAGQQWGQIGSPTTATGSAIAGQGNSGAAQEAQAIGRAATVTPLIAGAESNQLNAANQLFGAGGQLNTQQLTDMAAKLQAEGIPQQEAQNIANALYGQQQQKFNYASGVQQEPLGLIPNLLGQTSIQSATQTPGK